MTESLPLAGRHAAVVGAVDALARAVAVALAEAGALVSTTTLSADEQQLFYANSILNEAWALGRAGAAITIEGTSVQGLADALDSLERQSGKLDIIVLMPGTPVGELDEPLGSRADARLVRVRQAPAGYAVGLVPSPEETLSSAETLPAAVLAVAQ
ncbi:MAG: hypothetical protein GEU28_04600 [Dehalococcoidia bacterium]|nr:hypothetical protein [Dehalococcoidia bacterium]